MKKAHIKAEALSENTSQKDVSMALHPERGVHLIFVRATLPPSMLFADSVLLCRGYTISVPKA